MRCHYCDADAVIAPDHEGIKVGLCRDHIHRFMDALGDDPTLRAIQQSVE